MHGVQSDESACQWPGVLETATETGRCDGVAGAAPPGDSESLDRTVWWSPTPAHAQTERPPPSHGLARDRAEEAEVLDTLFVDAELELGRA